MGTGTAHRFHTIQACSTIDVLMFQGPVVSRSCLSSVKQRSIQGEQERSGTRLSPERFGPLRIDNLPFEKLILKGVFESAKVSPTLP